MKRPPAALLSLQENNSQQHHDTFGEKCCISSLKIQCPEMVVEIKTIILHRAPIRFEVRTAYPPILGYTTRCYTLTIGIYSL
jgi:hypothetical protein